MIRVILGAHWRTTLAALGVLVGTAGYVIQGELTGGHVTWAGVLKTAIALAGSYGLFQAADAKAR